MIAGNARVRACRVLRCVLRSVPKNYSDSSENALKRKFDALQEIGNLTFDRFAVYYEKSGFE